jgi:hypothetical protein
MSPRLFSRAPNFAYRTRQGGILERQVPFTWGQLIGVAGCSVAIAFVSACSASRPMTPFRQSETASEAGVRDLQLALVESRAAAGDRRAQLELGIRYEEGRGVERNLKRARQLYSHAAADSGGPVWTYIPSVGKGRTSRTVMVSNVPKTRGLAEAKERLRLIEIKLRMEPQDPGD